MYKQSILITGGAKGIGRALSKTFAANGYDVIINYNASKKEALSLEKEILSLGQSAFAIQADITNENSVNEMIDAAQKKYGFINLLINNAGITEQKLFTDISYSDWRRMLAVHVDGMFFCTKAVLPKMIEKKKGKVINISSIWGMTGASMEVHYSTAKAAIIGFTKALAKEVGPSGITINSIAPGIIDTNMNTSLSEKDKMELINQTPVLRFGTVKEIAACAVFLASDEASFITGQVISPNGGFII